MSTPLVVTHPCALIRDGLNQIFTKSEFRPVRILPSLTEEVETYLGSAGICLWLVGVKESASTANDLVRRVVAANPYVRAVILAASHTADDIVSALESGASGFLYQDIPGKQLIKSLELIVLGQTVTHPQFNQLAFASQMAGPAQETREFEAKSEPPANGSHTNGESHAPRQTDLRPSASVYRPPTTERAAPSSESSAGDVGRSLSRREMAILRTLIEGASNKIIARKLVITESTVKVHMKAILRKLRLQNRTQAAIWARTHLNELAAACHADPRNGPAPQVAL